MQNTKLEKLPPLQTRTQRKDVDDKTKRKQRKDAKVQEYTVIYKGPIKTQNNASEIGHWLAMGPILH